MTHRPACESRVGAQPARLIVAVRARAKEVGGEERCQQPRDDKGEEHRDRYRQAELLEVHAGNATHEADGRKDGDDGRRDGDDGETDLVGGIERGAIWRFAHRHVALDVLDLDDRVVDENARCDCDGEQADEIEREA